MGKRCGWSGRARVREGVPGDLERDDSRGRGVSGGPGELAAVQPSACRPRSVGDQRSAMLGCGLECGAFAGDTAAGAAVLAVTKGFPEEIAPESSRAWSPCRSPGPSPRRFAPSTVRVMPVTRSGTQLVSSSAGDKCDAHWNRITVASAGNKCDADILCNPSHVTTPYPVLVMIEVARSPSQPKSHDTYEELPSMSKGSRDVSGGLGSGRGCTVANYTGATRSRVVFDLDLDPSQTGLSSVGSRNTSQEPNSHKEPISYYEFVI